MCNWLEWRGPAWAVAAVLWALAGAVCAPALAQNDWPGIGRAATPQEVAAWDIDVRPDFKGLPSGAGSVAQGMVVWEGKCAACHGVFGESNQFFTPLVGGTTAQDRQTGHAARLLDPAYPGRSTLMKVATLSTLWDYINRAMPWNAPKSLSTQEVYAVLAYMLNLGGVLPDEATLSDRNIADVQQLMPNRKGTTTDHGLWPGRAMGNGGKPDVHARACMTNCVDTVRIVSALPDFARQAHGNLAEQNRSVGAQHGIDTRLPATPASTAPQAAPQAAPPPPLTAPRSSPSSSSSSSPSASPTSSAAASASTPAQALALTQQHGCTACHGVHNKIVGPAFAEVAQKYAQRPDAQAYLRTQIRQGGVGRWGAIPMPAQSLSEADAQTIANWLAAGALP